jgi:NTE family protein
MKNTDWLGSKPFTLSLSSGYFGFFAHTGFMMALTEVGLKPTHVVGSSAGALVAACYASGLSPKEMSDVFTSLKKSDFWDASFGFGLLRGRKMEDILSQYICTDFSQVKTRLSISVFDVLSLKTRSLKTGSIVKAVHASCAVPILFQPVKIEGRVYLDGGIADKLGLHGLSADELILTHNLRDLGGFELGPNSRKKFPYLLEFKLNNIPRSGPDQLHRGSDIIQESYKQTRTWLAASVRIKQVNNNLTLKERDYEITT